MAELAGERAFVRYAGTAVAKSARVLHVVESGAPTSLAIHARAGAADRTPRTSDDNDA
jgi:hypothetical protein